RSSDLALRALHIVEREKIPKAPKAVGVFDPGRSFRGSTGITPSDPREIGPRCFGSSTLPGRLSASSAIPASVVGLYGPTRSPARQDAGRRRIFGLMRP